eukprot:scaffold148342_cov36-Cyclotella_meneghiniana.AAC.4
MSAWEMAHGPQSTLKKVLPRDALLHLFLWPYSPQCHPMHRHVYRQATQAMMADVQLALSWRMSMTSTPSYITQMSIVDKMLQSSVPSTVALGRDLDNAIATFSRATNSNGITSQVEVVDGLPFLQKALSKARSDSLKILDGLVDVQSMTSSLTYSVWM